MRFAARPKDAGERATVLVLQTGFRSGPWVCRSLARAGFRVVGGHDGETGRLDGRSLHCRRVYRYSAPRRDADAFLSEVDDICRRESVSVVLPLDESVVHLLATREARLGPATYAGPNAEQYRLLCDKHELAQTARRARVGTPRGTTVTAEGREGDWPPLPSIVKPLTSATPVAGRVLYLPAQIVRTEREREETAMRVVAETGGAIVQEFVSGPGWLVDFVRDGDGLVSLTRLVDRRHPPLTGMPSVIRAADGPPGLVRATERLLDVADYHGHGSVQFLAHEDDFLVHDINLRIIFGVASTIAAGFDMPRLAVERALGRPLSFSPSHRKPVTYVWFGAEARSLRNGLRRREAAARPARVLKEIVLAGVLPRRILDPVSLRDPWVFAAAAGRAARRVGRRRASAAA